MPIDDREEVSKREELMMMMMMMMMARIELTDILAVRDAESKDLS